MQKFIKSLLSITTLILFLSIALFNSACEGPEGPSGKDGLDGADGNGTCGTCHSESADEVNQIFNQYHLSKHNMGEVFEYTAGRIACGGCHSGDGFAEAATLGQNDPVSKATSKINCKACHTIHKNYNETDFALRISAGFNLRHTNAAIDLKEGNTCAKCHQARPYTRTVPDTIRPVGGKTYSRFGPHYGTPANVVTMNGPVKIEGSTAYPTTNPHLNLAKGCVSCHMGSDPANPAVGGHTFLMPVANLAKIPECLTCHDAAKVASGALAKSVNADLATYRRILIDRDMLDTTQAFDHEGNYMVLGEYFATPDKKNVVYTNPKDVDVVLNYLYVAKDRSGGVHNPSYIKALIANGLEYLNQ